MQIKNWQSKLHHIPKLSLGFWPTPLSRISSMGGAEQPLGSLPQLWIKRDDCSGLAGGGNKIRKLEFLLADALRENADTVITTGVWQSNHARQTAAACAKTGFDCHLLLEPHPHQNGALYQKNGNAFLSHLFGAKIESHPSTADVNARRSALETELRHQGRTAYWIPRGGTNLIGDLGYISAVVEIAEQCRMQSREAIHFSHCVVGVGTGGTFAGLVAGFHLLNLPIKVIGVYIKTPPLNWREHLITQVEKLCDFFDYPAPTDWDSRMDMYADKDLAYGEIDKPTHLAITTMAQREGILLDPVYTGKVFAGLQKLIASDYFCKEDRVLFWHTGGLPGLFAYADQL